MKIAPIFSNTWLVRNQSVTAFNIKSGKALFKWVFGFENLEAEFGLPLIPETMSSAKESKQIVKFSLESGCCKSEPKKISITFTIELKTTFIQELMTVLLSHDTR